jgi:hypothetical protein
MREVRGNFFDLFGAHTRERGLDSEQRGQWGEGGENVVSAQADTNHNRAKVYLANSTSFCNAKRSNKESKKFKFKLQKEISVFFLTI